MHMNTTPMGDVIRNAREAKGLTQAVLAEKIDVSVRTVIAIEKDKRNPTFDLFYKLIHELNISADLVFYPGKYDYTPVQDQIIREFIQCSEQEQRVIIATARAIMREMRK